MRVGGGRGPEKGGWPVLCCAVDEVVVLRRKLARVMRCDPCSA